MDDAWRHGGMGWRMYVRIHVCIHVRISCHVCHVCHVWHAVPVPLPVPVPVWATGGLAPGRWMNMVNADAWLTDAEMLYHTIAIAGVSHQRTAKGKEK